MEVLYPRPWIAHDEDMAKLFRKYQHATLPKEVAIIRRPSGYLAPDWETYWESRREVPIQEPSMAELVFEEACRLMDEEFNQDGAEDDDHPCPVLMEQNGQPLAQTLYQHCPAACSYQPACRYIADRLTKRLPSANAKGASGMVE